jgi:hyperosmotically inducible protein
MRLEEEMRRNTTFATLLVATLVAVGLVACSSTQPPGEQLDDAAITAAIKAKYTGDPEINPLNIDVDTNEGVVTLSGRVDDRVTHDEAIKLARNTDGVTRVIDRIEVNATSATVGEKIDDAAITAKVKAKITADDMLNPFNIDVDTNDGVVTLSGRVQTADAKNRAGELARGTDGVKSVHNDLKVGDRA